MIGMTRAHMTDPYIVRKIMRGVRTDPSVVVRTTASMNLSGRLRLLHP